MVRQIKLVSLSPKTRSLGSADSLDEARELAKGYLLDPRDNIESVHFFDVAAEQFTGWLTKKAVGRG